MKKIDFIMIGAQKTATTTVYDWLREHPQVYVAPFKEVLYFCEDHLYQHGEAYLERCFRDAGNQPVWGMNYVHMLQSPVAVDRVWRYNPNTKIMAVLRNPIDRAYSAYWFARRSGWETCKTFEEGLAMEKARLKSPAHADQIEMAYLHNGDYAQHLERWIKRFGRDQVHAVFTEDVNKRPRDTLAGVLSFLGLDPATASLIDVGQRKNEAAMPKYPWLQKILLSYDAWYKRLGRAVVPVSARYTMSRYVFHPISRWNIEPFQYPKMNPETRARLAAEFAPKNARLGEMLGVDLSGWK